MKLYQVKSNIEIEISTPLNFVKHNNKQIFQAFDVARPAFERGKLILYNFEDSISGDNLNHICS